MWIVLVGASCAFLIFATTDGLDGNGQPNVVWRFALGQAAPLSVASLPDEAVAGDANRDETSEYPRYRGANGLGTVHGAGLAHDWSGNPPALLWRKPVGVGWSAFAIAGRQAMTQEQRGEEECVVCYDRHTGRELWVHRDAAYYQYPGTGDGPRATPTIDGDRVYSLGATGILNCLDRQRGEWHWTTNILKDHAAQAPVHGMVNSPLVVGNVVVVSAGGANQGSLVAYDKTTGQQAWSSGSDAAGYSSPMLVTCGGAPQIVIVNAKTLCGHDSQSGELLWTLPWENDTATNCSQPYPVGENRLFASTDYGKGCALVEITQSAGQWHVEPLWTSRAMQTKFSSAVVFEGNAYGLDDGILECVSLAGGRRQWKRGRYGHGQLLLADDLLVIQAEDGRVVLVEASPDSHRELGEFQALKDKTWNHPALAGRQLFVRNDHEAACYELPLQAD
jgi:outer membrane protein assembly factor BamB